MPLCPHCGEEEELELLEVWSSREFMISTCCEQSEEEARWGLSEDPAWARAALRRLGIEEICGETLRRCADDGCGGLVLDWQFRLGRIAFRDARRFIDRHHEHLPASTGWRFGQGLWNGPDLLGVVTVGQPLARAFDRHQVVEVTRLCVRRDRPDALRWNACSVLYGWAARDARCGLDLRRACRRPQLELARSTSRRSHTADAAMAVGTLAQTFGRPASPAFRQRNA